MGTKCEPQLGCGYSKLLNTHVQEFRDPRGVPRGESDALGNVHSSSNPAIPLDCLHDGSADRLFDTCIANTAPVRARVSVLEIVGAFENVAAPESVDRDA